MQPVVSVMVTKSDTGFFCWLILDYAYIIMMMMRIGFGLPPHASLPALQGKRKLDSKHILYVGVSSLCSIIYLCIQTA